MDKAKSQEGWKIMDCVEIFIVPVLEAREADYVERARRMAQVWIDHGALEYSELRAVDAPEGKLTSFPQAVKLAPGEVPYVILARYSDRAHRDAVWAKVFADPRTAPIYTDNPGDKARLLSGRFETQVILS